MDPAVARLVGVPRQEEVDRALDSYERYVQVTGDRVAGGDGDDEGQDRDDGDGEPLVPFSAPRPARSGALAQTVAVGSLAEGGA